MESGFQTAARVVSLSVSIWQHLIVRSSCMFLPLPSSLVFLSLHLFTIPTVSISNLSHKFPLFSPPTGLICFPLPPAVVYYTHTVPQPPPPLEEGVWGLAADQKPINRGIIEHHVVMLALHSNQYGSCGEC